MEFVCLYCRGSGKFRHERPEVSDPFWLQMTGGTMRCALCKGTGKLNRPVDSPVLDTGLIFCQTKAGSILVGCPDPACGKWIDATEFFNTRKKFESKCSLGHPIVMELQPTGGRP